MSGKDVREASGTPAAAVAERLRITEIFHSIQGEADAIGWRTVFVRLTGCPLRCVWCDTEYSFYGGNWHAIDDILAEVASHGASALDVSMVDSRVRKVMDLKAPDSGESQRNLWSNLDHLLPHDQIKIVIASRADYEWARAMLAEHALVDRCMVLFSPVHDAVEPRDLAEWIIADKLDVRFQLQLHKLLWNDAAGH